MAVEEIVFDRAGEYESLMARDPIECPIRKEERHHLFHQIRLIGKIFRNYFVFPLMSATDEVSRKILAREDWISSKLFWDSPFNDIRFPYHQQVKETFTRYDQNIVIKEAGKEIKIKCRVIETKGCPKEGADVLNHLIVQGNISTLDNNAPAVYPFLSSYIKSKEKNPQMPHARFVIYTHYGHSVCDEGSKKEEPYLPGDMDEWTFVFKKTVESIVNNYGKLEMISAHSLGNIPVIGHLNHVSDEEFDRLFPKTLYLSQGPSSIYEVTKNIPFECYPWGWTFGLGAFLYYLAKWTGWDISLDHVLTDRLGALPQTDFLKKRLKNTQIIVTEVAHDHYFPGKASLCASDRLESIDPRVNLYRLTFNPPLSWGVQRGQHNFNLGHLQRQDLMKEVLHVEGEKTVHLDSPKEIIKYEADHPLVIRHGESIVDAVLRPIWEKALEKTAQPPSLDGRILPIAIAQ